MASSLAFTPVNVPDIGKALAVLFESPEGQGSFTRASSTNVIVSGVPLPDVGHALEMVELLAPVHPARFFVPIVDASLSKVRAEIAAVCGRVSAGTAVCSEIVRLFVPEASRGSMPSIIRANMLPGLSSEVFVLGWEPSAELFIRQADQVFFDSQAFSSADLLQLLGVVISCRIASIDFNWVRLGMWREEIKRLFDGSSQAEALGELSRVVVHSSSYTNGLFDVTGLLLSGWIVGRLGLEPEAYGRSGWECIARNRRAVSVQLVSSNEAPLPGISAVQFFFKDSAGEERPLASIRRGEMLESQSEVGERSVLRRSIENEDIQSVVERFFLVGVSTFNYESSLKVGLEMYHLTRGFEE
jgi:glucose-6-phosphate dehydrogenase assembly protein OpcA